VKIYIDEEIFHFYDNPLFLNNIFPDVTSGEHTIKVYFNGMELEDVVYIEPVNKITYEAVFTFERETYNVLAHLSDYDLLATTSLGWSGVTGSIDDYQITVDNDGWYVWTHFEEVCSIRYGSYDSEAGLEFTVVGNYISWNRYAYAVMDGEVPEGYSWDDCPHETPYWHATSGADNSDPITMSSARTLFTNWYLQKGNTSFSFRVQVNDHNILEPGGPLLTKVDAETDAQLRVSFTEDLTVNGFMGYSLIEDNGAMVADFTMASVPF
jgi:hypothetical protein